MRPGSTAPPRLAYGRPKLEDAPTIRGVATAPGPSVAPAPLVGVVVRSSDRQPRPMHEWALWLLICGYPVWRLLGASLFIVPLLAIPMALELFRRRRVRFPAGSVIWILFIVIGVIGLIMINKTPPGAIAPTPGFGRYLAWAQRLADYVSALIILLYVGNLSERELPLRRIARMMAWFFIVVVIGGVLGILFPNTSITTPVAKALPHSLASNAYVHDLVTVNFAQVQQALADVTGARPAFPFDYTNSWGEALALLLPWFIIATMRGKRSLFQRIWPIAVLLVAVIPVVYSVNRGMWIGLIISVIYLVVRLAMRGRWQPVAIVMVAAAVAAIVVLTTPLGAVITSRLANPHSNSGRANINSAAIVVAKASPIIGWGGLSGVIGSAQSAAVGPSAACPECGNHDIGSDGQLWLNLISVGFVGAGLYVLFFLRLGWAYRRDQSWVGMAGGMTVLLALWFMTVYNVIEMPIMIMMVTFGAWWRNSLHPTAGGGID